MKIFAVASDPGSANAILPVIEYCLKKGHDVCGVASNAAALALKKVPSIKQIDDSASIESMTCMLKSERPQMLLSGAGAYNLLEHTVRLAVASEKIPCVAVLDYWSNYGVRFRRFDGVRWVSSMPDRICVLDEIVRKEMLMDGFRPEQVAVTGQPYFEYISDLKKHTSYEKTKYCRDFFVKDETTSLIGFCSEPILEDAKTGRKYPPDYTQYDIIEAVAKLLESISNSTCKKVHFVVRPHPREGIERIKELLMQFKKHPNFSWDVSNAGTSIEFINSCDLVVGMQSMALIESCILDKPTISVQLNLKHEDVFFGTTRGFCPSIYSLQNLNIVLEQWLKIGSLPEKKSPPIVKGSAKRVLQIIEGLLRKDI